MASRVCVMCEKDFDLGKRPAAITCSQECSRANASRKQKERRTRYQGTCIDCGAATDGSNGQAKAPKRCLNCSAAHMSKHLTVWTEGRIIESIRSWADEHGSPPGAFDFFKRPGYPAFSLVMRRFGSWNAAIEAAGYTPRKPGEHKQPRRGYTARSER
jgi:hypothetical protein